MFQSEPIMCSNIVAFLLLTSCRKGTSFDYLVKDFTKLHKKLKDLNQSFGFSFDSPSEVVTYTLNLLDSYIENINTKNGIKIIKPKLHSQLFDMSQSVRNALFVEGIVGKSFYYNKIDKFFLILLYKPIRLPH